LFLSQEHSKQPTDHIRKLTQIYLLTCVTIFTM
jgi:hypothetical protein